MIDSWGSGIGKIIHACKNDELPEPSFEAFQGGMLVTLFKQEDLIFAEKVAEKVTEKVAENQKKILIEIEKNPYISQFELSVLIGISRIHVNKNIAQLKANGFIVRIGADKGGYWKVIDTRWRN